MHGIVFTLFHQRSFFFVCRCAFDFNRINSTFDIFDILYGLQIFYFNTNLFLFHFFIWKSLLVRDANFKSFFFSLSKQMKWFHSGIFLSWGCKSKQSTLDWIARFFFLHCSDSTAFLEPSEIINKINWV